jgi:type IV pilus assembly protein PilO
MARLPFLEPLLLAPSWQKLVLGLVALATIGGAGYFFAVAPAESRVATLRTQRDAQQQELVRLRALAVELARTRQEAAGVERQLEVAKEKLPTQREIPALYRTLSDAAVQAGLAVALFQPQGPRIRDYYSEIPISLVAEGGYHEVGDFIGRVAGLPRATMIGELKLSGAVADASRSGPMAGRPPVGSVVDGARARRPVRAEMTLLTYVYRPVGSPPAPKPAGLPAKSDAKP